MVDRDCKYYVLFSGSEGRDWEGFNKIIRGAKLSHLSNPIKNKIPPPERNIYLDVSRSSFANLMEEEFQNVVALIIEDEVVFDRENLRLDVLEALLAVPQIANHSNPLIKYHGFYVAVFSSSEDIEKQSRQMLAIDQYLRARGPSPQVNADIVDGQAAVNVFLKNQLLRVAVAERMHRLEALS
ncbi:MAG: hypothetical protein AAGL19_17150 [Pseudomonadota bacterium]